MTWEDAFRLSTAVLASLGGGAAVILGFSSWLGKIWASRILNKEKHELEKLKNEHEIRFSKLHLERAEAIKEVAQCLQKLDDSFHLFLKNFQPVEEPDLETKISDSIKLHNELGAALLRHRLTTISSSNNTPHFSSELLDYSEMAPFGRKLWKFCRRNFTVCIKFLMIPFVFAGFMEVPIFIKIVAAP